MSDLDPRDYHDIERVIEHGGTWSACTYPFGCCCPVWEDDISDEDAAAILSDLVRRHNEDAGRYARMLDALRAEVR